MPPYLMKSLIDELPFFYIQADIIATEEAVSPANALTIYQSMNPICEPERAPTSEGFTIIDWNQTLTSVSAVVSCNEGYCLNGTSEMICDTNGTFPSFSLCLCVHLSACTVISVYFSLYLCFSL